MPQQRINPTALPNWSRSFSQVIVSIAGSRLVFVSGQVSVNSNNEIIGAGDLALQARTAFANLRTALEAGGANVRDVVRLGIHVVGYRPEHAEVIGDAMRVQFGAEALPTSTWLGVQALALEGLLIEVDAMAVVE